MYKCNLMWRLLFRLKPVYHIKAQANERIMGCIYSVSHEWQRNHTAAAVIPLSGVLLKAMIICDRSLFLLRITVLISAWEQVNFFVGHSPFTAGSVLVNACQSAQKRSLLPEPGKNKTGVALPSVCPLCPAAGFFLLKASASSPLLLICESGSGILAKGNLDCNGLHINTVHFSRVAEDFKLYFKCLDVSSSDVFMD